MPREITLTHGKIAIVDDDKYELLSRYTWHWDGKYVRTYIKGSAKYGGKPRQIRMHQLLLDCPKGYKVDHINGDRTNNTLKNLRIVSNTQSSWNTRKVGKFTSSYKGVCLHSDKIRWRTEISVEHKRYFLGLYESEEEAARVYDSAVRYYYGEYGVVNFPEGETLSYEQIRERYSAKEINRKEYIGVSFNNKKNKWMASITLNNISKCLGFYDNIDDAARAYDKFIISKYGKKAKTNFPK